MSETGISDPVLVIIASLLTMSAGAVAWVCKNKCRNQTVECNSGCCNFHSDSRLQETIRATVVDELRRSQSIITPPVLDLEQGPERGHERPSD